MITMKQFFIFVAIALSLDVIHIHRQQSDAVLRPKNLTIKEHIITVFVHGTVNAPRTAGDILSALRGNFDNTKYGQKVSSLRNDSFFYQCQAMQGQGLIPIDMNIEEGNASGMLANIFQISYSRAFPEHSKQSFYTFGWSGALSEFDRLKAAENLYSSLHELIIKHRERGIRLRVNLIGYSHGGTVCLNMSNYYSKKDDFTIDNLVLLGTPIQKSSYLKIGSPLFSSIYNIYSNGDSAQTLDWISCDNHELPKRTFIHKRGSALPSKLKQIKLKLVEYKETNSKGRFKRLVYHPNHFDFWFFSWSFDPKIQNKYPLKPIPIAAFVPKIMEVSNNSKVRHITMAVEVKDGHISFESQTPESLLQALMPHKLISNFAQGISEMIPSNYHSEYMQKCRNTMKRFKPAR